MPPVALTFWSEWALLWQFSNARQVSSNIVTLGILCNTKRLVITNSDFIHKKNTFFFFLRSRSLLNQFHC